MENKKKRIFALLFTFALIASTILGASSVFAQQQQEQQQDKDLKGILGDTIIICKVDKGYVGPYLKGAKFKVSIKEKEEDQWELLTQEPKIAEDGRIIYSKYDEDNWFPYLNNFYIKIEEVSAPDGYTASKPIEGKIYDAEGAGVENYSGWRYEKYVENGSDAWKGCSDHYFIIGNDANKNDFTVKKVDENGNPLEGAEFVIYGKGELLIGGNPVPEPQEPESEVPEK